MATDQGKNSPMAYSLLRQLSHYSEVIDRLNPYKEGFLPSDMDALNLFPHHETRMRIIHRAISGAQQDLTMLGYTIREIRDIVYRKVASR